MEGSIDNGGRRREKMLNLAINHRESERKLDKEQVPKGICKVANWMLQLCDTLYYALSIYTIYYVEKRNETSSMNKK